ncbi:MAG: hypothetical protein BEN19_01970 [Epulopiscium sp. Nuni2H_MBin003]|nr:MAG: hypothetical protein BEN19_01970 [Epulopiscium sp. Nuni2H_MBin003]
MVTIEQKLALFSKLMQQDTSEKLKTKTNQITEHYKEEKERREKEIKEQAKRYVIEEKKVIKTKLASDHGKIKLDAKKQILQIKQACVEQAYEELYKKLDEYTDSQEYINFLQKSLTQVEPYLAKDGISEVHLSKKDFNNHYNLVKSYLNSEDEIKSDDKIIVGGIILKKPQINIQIDLSLDSEISDKYEELVSIILEAIQKEVGISE